MKWIRENKTEKWNPFNYRTFPDEQEKHKDVSVHEEHVQHLHDVNGLVTKEEETRKTGTFVRLHARTCESDRGFNEWWRKSVLRICGLTWHDVRAKMFAKFWLNFTEMWGFCFLNHDIHSLRFHWCPVHLQHQFSGLCFHSPLELQHVNYSSFSLSPTLQWQMWRQASCCLTLNRKWSQRKWLRLERRPRWRSRRRWTCRQRAFMKRSSSWRTGWDSK